MANYDSFSFSNFEDIFNAMNGFNNMTSRQRAQMQRAQEQASRQRQSEVVDGKKNEGLLEQFGINMTEMARKGKFDPVIGRNDEIKRVIEILNRRTKNNPVLIGEAGVGKTAVVEGLAQSIVDGQVPVKLQGKEVIRLDVVSMVQGTGVRGQFEERMQKLMDEVIKREDIILFIDEIHEIMGAGSVGESDMDAGNILKPALARGEFQLVGATTLNEYRHIEKDAAIARRFQTVKVDEPSFQETIQILNGIRGHYEDYHKVKYSDDSLNAAVELSSRYILDRFLPDKAIDLMDEAGSRKNLMVKVDDPKKLDNQIKYAENMKKQSIDDEDYEKAGYWKSQIEQLNRQKKVAQDSKLLNDKDQIIEVEDIQKIVEEKTGIPVGNLQKAEQKQLQNLADNLSNHVIGQKEATKKISRAIRRNRVGFNKANRPIGSFLFVGPTGVGKTETAKQLAKELFGTTDSMIRFDMSEYMEKHSVSKLIGAPAGYIGYEEAGQLTEAVRRRPYSLILLDEVEKAHPDVMNMFLQILDDGRLTDAQGHVVSFKDTIIIMTSNAGTKNKLDENEHKTELMDRLAPYFKPEFLNRFDGIIEFNSLTKLDLMKILKLLLLDMNEMISSATGLTIKVDDDVQSELVNLGYDPAMGARPLRRVIQEQLEDKIADFYLDNPKEHNLEARLENNKIVIKSVMK